MRKILSGLLATAMVASVCATMSFAATVPDSDATSSVLKIDLSKVALEKTKNTGVDFAGGDKMSGPAAIVIAVKGGTIEFQVPGASVIGGMTSEELAKLFASVTPVPGGSPVDAGGTALTGASFNVKAEGSTIIVTSKSTGANSSFDPISVSLTPSGHTNDAVLEFENTTLSKTYKSGKDPVAATVDAEGSLKANLRNIVVCDDEGNPIPLTEKDQGIDKDQNSEDGVQSGQTVYFMIKDGGFKFDDDTYWKLKISKGDNGKYIKALSEVSKTFGGDLYSVYDHNTVDGTGGTRHRYIKCEMNEIYTDDEYKITLDLRLTPKSKAVEVFGPAVNDDDELKVKDFFFYMKNIVKDADGDWEVGVGGLMLNPLENDWNEVTYYDEDGDLAFMKFFADSDVSKFYAKLSTKWEHADYASYFNDQDAYIFDFTGSPKISATSRCDLQIYNPFVDEDGNESIDPESATIYQVIDGDLFDVTDNFTYEEGDNGDMAFVTRTRFLGTYIICEKPVEEAADGEAPDTDLVPEDTTPVEVTPGNDDGGKAPANTGKYL